MFVSLQNCLNLTLIVMGFGGGAFGRWLGLQGGTLMSGATALIKETPESSPALFATWWNSEKMAVYDLGSKLSPNTESWTFLPLDHEKFVLFISQVYGILL